MQHQLYVYRTSLRSTGLTRPPNAIERGHFSQIDGPLVSCLMVTRGATALVRSAVAAFHAQTYLNKELVVVCDAGAPALAELAGAPGIRVIDVSTGHSLGHLRNVSIAQARGDIVCQWDDDDLYAPFRLAHGVGALLQARLDAVFLRQWMLWSPSRQALVLSGSALWEGSMIARKAALGPYPGLRRGEDTEMVDEMARRSTIAVMDDPLAYAYVMHGQNTWTEEHMQKLMVRSRQRFHYGRGLAAFSSTFDFAGHPALDEGSRTLLAAYTGDHSQMRRLARHVRVNQWLRRVRHRLGRHI